MYVHIGIPMTHLAVRIIFHSGLSRGRYLGPQKESRQFISRSEGAKFDRQILDRPPRKNGTQREV